MTTDEPSSKDQNRTALLTITVANSLVFYLLATAQSIQVSGFTGLLKNWLDALPAGALFVVTTVLVEFLDATTKARLIFWRWSFPLPGARVFSELIQKDDRIDIARLGAKIGEFPTSPRDQNALWYRLYLGVQTDPRVVQVHRNFLFTRDYTSISALFLVAGAVIWSLAPHSIAEAYDAGLLAQYLIVRRSAKHHGERFATTVLALFSAS